MPALMKAAEISEKISPDVISNIKGFRKLGHDEHARSIPKISLDALNILFYGELGNEPITWNHNYLLSQTKPDSKFSFISDSIDSAKSLLSTLSKEFLQKMAREENSNLINDEVLELLEPYIQIFDTVITESTADNISKPSGVLREYIMQIYEFSMNTRIVKPKRAALILEEQNLKKANSELLTKDIDLKKIIEEKQVLEDRYKAKKDEADKKEEIAN